MPSKVISVENLWKEYRIGVIGHGTLVQDIQSWWARIRGKEDPNSIINSLAGKSEKQFRGNHFLALEDINIAINEGEIVGIIGKNGAGKSTLLKILSRVTAPSKGVIKIKGRIASLLEVGTGFHPELSGRENVFLNGLVLGMKHAEIKKKFDEIIDFSGVSAFVDTPVKRYSSGMKVRLGFAVAAHLDSDILVVDEALAVGDREFQNKCIRKMSDIRQTGKTILFVSHNMTNIERLCNRGILLENGKIKAEGQINQIIDTYITDTDLYKETGSAFYIRNEPFDTNIKACIASAELLSENNQVNSVIPGTDIDIVIKYKSNFQGLGIELNVGIYNNNEGKIIHIGTGFSNLNIPAEKDGTIKCKIKKLLLPQGDYFINFSLQLDGQVTDWQEKAIRFRVKQGDFYGSGREPTSKETRILADCSWNIIKQ